MAHPRTTQNELNLFIGNQIKKARVASNLTQAQLAPQIGISYQQLQKYEKGTNRVSATRLLHLAMILEMPVCWFYGQMPITSKTA